MSHFRKKKALKMHFFAKKFGHVKKKQYFCSRFRLRGTLTSSGGGRHLHKTETPPGPLAQLNRVPHYGCGGCRFESCMDHKDKRKLI